MEIGYLIFHKYHKFAEDFKTRYEFCIKTVHDIYSLSEKKVNKDHERVFFHHII